jgi:hypothetical protein
MCPRYESAVCRMIETNRYEACILASWQARTVRMLPTGCFARRGTPGEAAA